MLDQYKKKYTIKFADVTDPKVVGSHLIVQFIADIIMSQSYFCGKPRVQIVGINGDISFLFYLRLFVLSTTRM